MQKRLLNLIFFCLVPKITRGAYDPNVELVQQLALNSGTITCYPNNDSTCKNVIDGNMATSWYADPAYTSNARITIFFVSQVLIGAVLIQIDPKDSSGNARTGTLDVMAGPADLNGNPTTRCSGSLNGIDANVRGGVFNCNTTGNVLSVSCIGICYPKLNIRFIKVWSKYAISTYATASLQSPTVLDAVSNYPSDALVRVFGNGSFDELEQAIFTNIGGSACVALTWPNDVIVNGIFIYVQEGSVGLVANMNTINGVWANLFNQAVNTRSMDSLFTTTETGKQLVLCNSNQLKLQKVIIFGSGQVCETIYSGGAVPSKCEERKSKLLDSCTGTLFSIYSQNGVFSGFSLVSYN